MNWLGDEYKKLGEIGTGVYQSLDGKRKVRLDNGSLSGTHSPYKPHGHLEIINGKKVISNNHIIIKDDK